MVSRGLDKRSWEDVIESLEEFLPYYERVNYASTLLQLPRWRSRAASIVQDGEEVLEIGPGAGGFAKLLHCRRVYLLEPSASILGYSSGRLNRDRYASLMGLAEEIPLKEGTLDKVFCIFSFRDFMDKGRSLREIHRVLRPGGQLHIIDLFKAPEGAYRALMNLWLERGATAILRLLVPRRIRGRWRHDPYLELLRTYRAVGTAGEYEELMRHVGFTRVGSRDLLFRSVYHMQGAKPSTT